MTLKNLSTAHKIFGLVLFMALVLALVGIISYSYLLQSNKNTASMYKDRLVPIQRLETIKSNSRTNEAFLLEIIMASNNNLKQQRFLKNMQTKDEEIDQIMKQLASLSLPDQEKKMLKRLNGQLMVYREQRNDTVETAMKGDADGAYQSKLANNGSLDALNATLQNLVDYNVKDAERIKIHNDQSAGIARNTLIAVIVAVIAAALAAGWVLARKISGPIFEVMKISDQISSGNLTVNKLKIETGDEAGRLSESMNRMVDQMRHLIREIKMTSVQVSDSSKVLITDSNATEQATADIAATIQELAGGATMQMDDSSETVEAMKASMENIRQIEEAYSSISHSTRQMSDEAEKGGNSIGDINNQMKRIHLAVSESTQVVEELQSRSRGISDIVGMMSEIVTQTHLLALNASIEAAHAGEHGRSFAVVAGEVRKLAQQSDQFLKQIQEFNSDMSRNLQRSVNVMETVNHEVLSGEETVQSAGVIFERIVDDAVKISGQMEELSASTNRMSVHSKSVVEHVNNVLQIAREFAGHAQKIAASTEKQMSMMGQVSLAAVTLNSVADRMYTATGQFRID